MSRLNLNLCLIQDYVDTLASKQRVKKFYPQTVSRKLNMPLEIVVIELTKLIQEGKIELKYEIRCSEDLNRIDNVIDYNPLIDDTRFCEVCGENVEITYSDVYPVYYISEEYKKLKKKL